VVFCRYIATANYLEGVLKEALKQERVHVLAITGELPSEVREERIRALAELEEGIVPVLVATDCLSEGVNLQRHFDGVVHYDLTWNPTRHEQREGRVDRFGQGSPVVRTLMLYGSNNPVDGAVLKVILRKAEKIRKELGVAVPLPMDNTQVIEAVMQAVLLHNPKKGALTPQLSLGFEEVEHQVDVAWERERDRVSRTVFAQKRLRPDEVLPEWQKAVSFMGGEKDVYRFVREVSTRLGAALEEKGDHYRFPCGHLPKPLQERLESVGLSGSIKLAFQHPAPTGVDFCPPVPSAGGDPGGLRGRTGPRVGSSRPGSPLFGFLHRRGQEPHDGFPLAPEVPVGDRKEKERDFYPGPDTPFRGVSRRRRRGECHNPSSVIGRKGLRPSIP
jgi:Superfamily II DNA and RNA helicases